ncbi:MAG: phage Gp37/Gp68 family protein [Chloroflexi bacterium]|nr:phage Gp37/Gp68 family protein [Chloroflexota bacterium]
MSDRSGIEWTDATWNPVTGCTKVSPGCAHCYAEALTLRFHRGGAYLPGEATVRIHPERLGIPGRWKSPRRIFVNSMSDLFHEEVPLPFIQRVFEVMRENERHTFQILTKRHIRLAELAPFLSWPPNVWMGVSVENQLWTNRRIPYLKQVPAAIRFLSCEPLLRRIDLGSHLDGIHWVIVGGESGPRARPLDVEWIRDLRDQCQARNVPFFLKQLGGHPNQRGHDEALLDGRLWREMPKTNLLVGLRA